MGENLMAYKEYSVKEGDCISSIAYDHALFPDTIWNDSKNSELKKKRKNPNTLLPGDVIYIRDKEEKEESCPCEQKHRFRRKGVPAKLKTQILIGELPCENEEYVLDIDGMRSRGKTDADGNIEITIPPNAKKGLIIIQNEEFELTLGTIDPIEEKQGVIQRLENLGFYEVDEDDDTGDEDETGEEDGEDEDPYIEAIKRFQESVGLEPTGEADQQTLDRLVEIHGS
jgi:hypothetical protein